MRYTSMKKSTIGEIDTKKPQKEKKNSWRFSRSIWRWIKLWFFTVCVFLVVFFGQYLMLLAQGAMWTIKQTTVNVVSQTLWKKMETDIQGNINVLLVGFGGEKHSWAYLADTIIVASFSPEDKSVTMISLPRDLYVGITWQFANKINALFAWKYNKNKDLNEAALALAEKASEITWLTIPYYALVDFQWFRDVVDSVWGVDIDVPYNLTDRAYPNGMRWYEIFSVKKWLQIFDGDTALKYARSRHSTSDFSRALRQQQIIQWVISKIMSTENIINPAKWTELYDSYKTLVTTNIDVDEMLWLTKYAVDMPHINSFVLTMECSTRSFTRMKPWCLLYPWKRDAFGGMSVILPIWWSQWSVSFYDNTQFFGYVVAHNQAYLNEGMTIEILNWIDEDVARQYRYREWLAGKMATKLTNFAFDIASVDNTDTTTDFTSFVYHGTWSSEWTVEALWLFMDISQETSGSLLWTWYVPWSGIDATIILWNDFLERYGNESFSYFR